MDLQRLKANLALRLFAWRYIPVIGFCAPVIEQMDARALRIRIPLGWRTRNHLGSMYFKALSPPVPTWWGSWSWRRAGAAQEGAFCLQGCARGVF